MPIEPGIYTDLTNAEYHGDPAIGSSGINEFIECPRLYQYNYLEGKKEKTEQMRFGNGAHVYVLEPDIFDLCYKVAPESMEDRRGNKWKDFVAEAEVDGKEPMLHKDFVRLEEMRAGLLTNRMVRGILRTQKQIECSYFARDEATGLMTKARPDIFANGVIIDYKTCATSLGVSNYSKHAYGLGRHIQAYHHKSVVEACGVEVKEVWHLVQSTKAPYLARILKVTAEWLDLGRVQAESAIGEIKDCMDRGVFPGYPDNEVEDLVLPAWAGYEIN